jgi:KAP-like P-loop domain-containing protein
MVDNTQPEVLKGLTRGDLISNRALDEDGEDQFGYRPIAGRVAETLTVLDPPLTVGLFGPWGSGKSSMFELLRRELKELKSDARLVRYDASTYGGEALKRNFISHIAGELGYEADEFPDFHRGLYESTRRTDLDFEAIKKSLWPAARMFGVLYVAFLLIACLLVGLTSIATNEDFLGEIARTLPALIAPSAIGGVVTAVAALLLKGASFEAEQSQPASDEAFARCFQVLVKQGLKDKKFKRLIVFVDELDRCSPEDVVTTLTAIRTFLDDKHSVFVVAADRAALERALEEKLPQPTPVDEENPYYSSASAFFDKVFHDRVPLPPLRGPRLYEWAYDQVKERDGYWAELRDGQDHSDLRRTLYFLIPSHVRAPRRVKVLLNSFIRNAAIAAHSGLDWRTRAREIAKLTVLDTEFPALGDDLRVEHRLPALLLSPPSDPSDRVERLLRKHGSYQVGRPQRDTENEGAEPEAAEIDAAEPVDAVIATTTHEQARALTESEHELLRRYLARTRAVAIGRDLIFLDPAGAAIGLEDPELGERLDQAVDVPDEVVEHVKGLDLATRRLAARVLAHMVETEFGDERTNVMTALMGVAEGLGEEVSEEEDRDETADEIVGAVQSYARDERLDEQHLVGALSLALYSHSSDLEKDLFEDERLLAADDRIERVTGMLPRIPERYREVVYGAVAEAVGRNVVEPITETVSELPMTDAAALIEDRSVSGAIATFLLNAEEGAPRDWLPRQLYRAADEHEGGAPLRLAVHELLLHEELAYELMRDNAERALGDMGEVERADYDALRGLAIAPEADHGLWVGFLSAGDEYSATDNGRLANRAIRKWLSGLHAADETLFANRRGLLEKLLPFFGMSAEEEQLAVRDALVAELTANTWWAGPEALQRQERLHELGRLFAEHATDTASAAFMDALTEDAVRGPMDVTNVTPDSVAGVNALGESLGARAIRLLEHLAQVGQHPDAALAMRVTSARASLALAAREDGAGVDASALTLEEVTAAAATRTDPGRAAVRDWLRLEPPRDQVETLIRELGDASASVIVEGVGKWAAALSQEERTELAIGLVDAEFDASRWVAATTREGVDEVALVEHIANRVREASRGDRREELAAMLAAVRSLEAGAQRAVADLVIELLETGKGVDFKAATKAVPALGTQHRSAGRLQAALKTAAEDHNHQLSERTATELADAGVRVPKKAVKKGTWGRVKDLFR